MLYYPDIDPIALSFTIPVLDWHLKVHWYGIAYLLGFAAAWFLGRYRAKRPSSRLTPIMVDDLIFFCIIGVVVGGRLGYMLFYGFDRLLDNPLNLFRVWEGGMAFHGGVIGVLIALWVFSRRYKLGFFVVGDFLAPLVPLGLLFGRIGNFVNGELWGHPTDVPWAMRVPCAELYQYCRDLPAGSQWSLPLHPSQLYEAALEGLVLFVILWLFSSRPRPRMAVGGLFLMSYGVFRFSVEFVRQPDAHIGFLAWDWVTMGQMLSLPMILAGALMLMLAYRRKAS